MNKPLCELKYYLNIISILLINFYIFLYILKKYIYLYQEEKIYIYNIQK